MQPEITLYTFPPSQNAVRPEIALLEKGLEFEKVVLDLFSGAHKKPPMIDFNPRGQVPTLVYGSGDDAIGVHESIAQIRFIDDMHPDPPLMPSTSEPRERAIAIIRIEEFQAKLDPVNIFGSVIFGKQTREQLGDRVDKLLAEIDRWDGYVKDQEFLAGERFTLADIAVFPLLMHFEALGFAYEEKTPALHAYMERCKARPSIVKTEWVPTFTSFVQSRDPGQVLSD